MAEIKALKSVKKPPSVEVDKFSCDCVELGSWLFRATRIGDEVFLECEHCKRDFGPLYVTRSAAE